ncbi:MAG TPA: hypothetical protein VI322_05450 [Candidatus Saccharimonadia bacterium]
MISHYRFPQDGRGPSGSAQDTTDRDGVLPQVPNFQNDESYRLFIYVSGLASPIVTTYTPDIAKHENIGEQVYTIPVTIPANATITKIVAESEPRTNSGIDSSGIPYDGDAVLPVCAALTHL